MNHEELEDCIADVALYALGSLPNETARAVQLRLLSGCPFCVAQAEHCAGIAESLSMSVAPAEPQPRLWQRLFDRIQRHDEARERSETIKIVRSDESQWVKMPVPGVEIRRLIGDRTLLVRMEPGAVYPPHDHLQTEQTYVMQGSITGSDGVTLYAGDFSVMAAGSQHGLIRSETGCTLFVVYSD